MTKLSSPRSGAKKAVETTIDLSALATVLVVIIPVLRARGWLPSEVTGEQATAAGMALGGIVMRVIRHLWVYRGK